MARSRPSELRLDRRPRSGWTLVPALIALTLAGCGDGVPGVGAAPTVSSEIFVEAVVELRTSDLLDDSGYLPEGEPERILEERGLEPDDLRRFVEEHGGDVPLMAGLWEEIDRRVSEARTPNAPES